MSTGEFKSGCVDKFPLSRQALSMLKRRRRTYIKQWRKHRGLSQEQLADRINMTAGNLSMIERGLTNYTQETLERMADALNCEPADLLMRNPADPDAIWTIWDEAKPAQKKQIIEVSRALIKTGS